MGGDKEDLGRDKSSKRRSEQAMGRGQSPERRTGKTLGESKKTMEVR